SKKYGGFGAFMVLISNQPTLKDVRIDHLTAVSSRVVMNVGIKQAHMQNFVFTNNLIGATESQVTSTGGPNNCVVQPERQGPHGIAGVDNAPEGALFRAQLQASSGTTFAIDHPPLLEERSNKS